MNQKLYDLLVRLSEKLAHLAALRRLPKAPAVPSGLQAIKATFGDIDHPDFEKRSIVLFDLPYPLYYEGEKVTRSRAHWLIVPRLIWVFEELKRRKLDRYVQNYGGIYNQRAIRGSAFPSTHSWGIAIDIEPEAYRLGSTKRLPAAVIEVFNEAGFSYGGDFPGRKDPQHFQYAMGY